MLAECLNSPVVQSINLGAIERHGITDCIGQSPQIFCRSVLGSHLAALAQRIAMLGLGFAQSDLNLL